MKNKIIFFFLLFFSISGVINCQKQDGNDLSLIWNIDSNVQQSGKFRNSATLINESNKPVLNNWVIYFNQFSSKFEFEENSPIEIEHISGTLFKMYPTQYYKILNVGDSLTVVWQTTRAFVGRSYLPDGAYIVFSNKGIEETPKMISSKIIRNDDQYLALTADGKQRYYPFADVVFEENLKYITDVSRLSCYDIIPTVKSIDVIRDVPNFVLGKDISIISDPYFLNESHVLKLFLKNQLDCSFSNNNSNTMVLSKLDGVVKNDNSEYYELNIHEDEILIKSTTTHGMFNGIQTLMAILANKSLPIQLAQCRISDYPDLPYRGIMLDISRNFTTKDNLLKLIDYLSIYKINKLHLHLADDEGWRVEIPGLEELTEVASRRGHTIDESDRLYPAYGSGWDPQNSNSSGNGYYSRQDFIDILKYAKSRHITIIPEIDLPGHSRAAIVAMNARYNKYKDSDINKAQEFLLIESADTSKYVSVQNYNDNVVNVALPSTYRFVNKVIDEMSKIYTDAGLQMNVLHIGGDEVPKGAWTGSPVCKELMKTENMKEARELKDYFVQQVLDICRPRNIQIAGWQEIVLKPHANEVDHRFVEDNVISYCWNTAPYRKADEIPYRLANKNFNVVLCNAPNLYMDFAYSPDFYEPGLSWGGYVNEFNSFDVQPFDIYKSIRRTLDGQPLINNNDGVGKEELNSDARKYILGIQGQLFSETIRNFDMVTYYLFPKLLGLSERGWNAESDWVLSQDKNDYLSAVSLFNEKIGSKELPRLSSMNINYRIPVPGLKVENGKLYANCRITDAEVRYTTDGSEPNIDSTLWEYPIDCKEKFIKAKTFYKDKESVTSILRLK